MVCFDNHIAVLILNCLTGEASCNTLLETLNLFSSIHECLHYHAGNLILPFTAVYLTDNQILRYVYQTSCQISRVSSTQSRIGQTLTCSMRGHKVLQYVQSFTEIRLDRQLNGMTCGIGHQSTHTGQLLNLLIGTTRSGISHHIDVVVFIQTIQQRLGQNLVRLLPGFNNLFVTLFLGNQSALIVARNLIHRILRILNQLRLLRRHGHIGNRYGHCRSCRVLITHSLDVIQHLGCPGCSMRIDNLFQNLL